MLTERPWVLGDTTWPVVRDTAYTVAVVPWGATEAHNQHLPYGTDTIETEHVAYEAARLAWEAGARAIVLPPVPFGVNTSQLDIPLCLNMNPTTQLAVLRDIVVCVALAGIGKLVILNGHGGNDFRQMIRELQPETDLFLCTMNWYNCVDPKVYFTEPGDHAGELETSMMQHLTPDLVRPLSEAGDGRAKRFRVRALREGWAWAPRQWTLVTADTGVGNPRASNADKGARFFAATTERIGEFLVELAAADLAAMYGD
jgi:creatinine amidohydrolase